MFSIETVANNIYSACTEFNKADYKETKEKDLSNLESALSKLDLYACYNEDFKTLAECLRVLYDD